MPTSFERGAASSDSSRAATLAAAAIILGGCLVVALIARHVTFSGDDWSFLLQRRGLSADVFLRPHNEHLSALPILAYKVLLQIFGAGSYAPFMALLLFVHATVCALLYVLARRHVGPWAALAAPAILVVLGPAWQDLVWAFQIGYLGSVAAGLGTVLCLEHRRDAAAASLLTASLLCSSVGLGMVVLAAVYLVLQRPLVWRRLWTVAVPVALYAVWYAIYGVTTARGENVVHIPSYLAQAVSAAFASITGLGHTPHSPFLVSTSSGGIVALVAAVLLVFSLVRGNRPPAIVWAALAAAVALWLAECIESFPNGREAAQSRYQYTAATLLLLAIAGVLHGWRPTVRSGSVLAVATLLICGSNVVILHRDAAFSTVDAQYTSAETGAMQVARNVVSATFRPEGDPLTIEVIGDHNLSPVTARAYFSAVDAFGSSADTPEGIRRRPERVREAADEVVAEAERLTLAPVAALPAPAQCRSAAVGSGLGEVAVRPGTVVTLQVQRGSPAALALRRFAAADRFVSFGNTPPEFHLARLQDGRPLTLTLPRDESSAPWILRVAGGRGVRLCVAPA